MVIYPRDTWDVALNTDSSLHRLIPKSLHTCPPAKTEDPSSPPLHSGCPSPSFKPPLLSTQPLLVQLSHAPQQVGPTYLCLHLTSASTPPKPSPPGPTHHPQTLYHHVAQSKLSACTSGSLRHLPSLPSEPSQVLSLGRQVWGWSRRRHRDPGLCQARAPLVGGAVSTRNGRHQTNFHSMFYK